VGYKFGGGGGGGARSSVRPPRYGDGQLIQKARENRLDDGLATPDQGRCPRR